MTPARPSCPTCGARRPAPSLDDVADRLDALALIDALAGEAAAQAGGDGGAFGPAFVRLADAALGEGA